jgi:molecular chaperone GrpE
MNSEPKADEAQPVSPAPKPQTQSQTNPARGPGQPHPDDLHEAVPPVAATSYVDPSIALEAKTIKQEEQIRDLTDRLLRTHAEMDNIRKRTEREKGDTAKYAITKFAGDIVTMGDNFARAIQAVPAGAADTDPALKSLIDGVVLIERDFLSVLERHGVSRIDPLGEAFNPNFHQAVMETQTTDVQAGTVLQVFSPGYVIEDRVLRPAMVVVAKGGFKPVKPGAPSAAPAAAAPPAAAPTAEAADDGPPPPFSKRPQQG